MSVLTLGEDFLSTLLDSRPRLLRLLPTGQVDTTFGTAGDGVVVGPGSSADSFFVATIDAVGNIVVAGYRSRYPSYGTDFLVERYSSAGVLDPSFGVGGVCAPTMITGEDVSVTGLEVLDDGSMVAIGRATTSSSFVRLVRLDPAGNVDPDFDGFGHAYIQIAYPTVDLGVPVFASVRDPADRCAAVVPGGFPYTPPVDAGVAGPLTWPGVIRISL